MDLKQIGCEDVDWILLARNRDQWRVLVKKVKNIPVARKGQNILRDERRSLKRSLLHKLV
jgi:hypothetical protein